MEKGDILELIDNDGLSAPIGSTARVIGVNVSLVNIEWIDKGGSGQMNGEYGSYRFKVIISPEEAFENQNNKTVMSKQKLTVPVTDVLRIHSVACVDWKERIAKFLSRVNADQTITFTQSEVDTMFEASTKSQLPLLEEIFGKQVKELTLKEITGNRKLFSEEPIEDGAMIEVRVHGEFKDKAFWLHQSYNWEIKRDSSNLLCLIPTPKQN